MNNKKSLLRRDRGSVFASVVFESIEFPRFFFVTFDNI